MGIIVGDIPTNRETWSLCEKSVTDTVIVMNHHSWAANSQ